MANTPASTTIDKNPCARGGQQGCDPIPPSGWETDMFQHFQEEWPCDTVEGLGEVDLEQDARHLADVEPTASELDGPEVVVDAASFDESCLVGSHEFTDARRQTVCQALGEQLAHAVDQTYGPVVVLEAAGGRSLGDQGHYGAVNVVEATPVLIPKGGKQADNVRLDVVPNYTATGAAVKPTHIPDEEMFTHWERG